MTTSETSGGAGEGKIDGFLKSLQGLKYLEEKTSSLEIEFYKEVQELEKKYNKLFDELFTTREEITSGKKEPLKNELAESDIVTMRLAHIMSKQPKLGIPNFWFWVFKNSAKLYELVQRSDVPILAHLKDVKLVYTDDPMGFILEFRFGRNQYFSNDVLTKEYSGSVNKLGQCPPSFDSPIINSSRGCHINWHPGMDPSYRLVNMQQSNEQSKLSRVIVKPVKMKTFFNFFNPPSLPSDERVDLKPEYVSSVTRDYEIGLYFREEIIPNAYLFFTGQIVEKDDHFVDVQILPDRQSQAH